MRNRIINEYNGLNLLEKLYIVIRWRLCPFELIEEHVPKEGFIVDIGCGCGLLPNTLHLLSTDRKILGIDLSNVRLAVAKKSEKEHVKFERKDVKELELQSCDAIVMSDFLHHISYELQESVIKEAATKLKQEGKLIILDLDKKPYWKFLVGKYIDKIMAINEKTYYRDRRGFKEMLERNGLSVNTLDADLNLPLSDVLFVCAKK
ncbi:hypothetical protein COV16_00355 [Candidatus Woesearchaeota archaeon CG10_big_fil_rev_8_21_14_0_10_34_8]|nr:MAG: hypothetical protein COV16_00355 [Candidatus Woesearchaeota archaeon CG10_big_fil_rev_8_21_14_0_10_34_8]